MTTAGGPAVQADGSGAVAAPSGPVAAAAGSTTGGGTSAGVAHQVFDQIGHLATSGNGTHRVTLRLDPGTLGEVKVHLTVREGRVRVRLTGGDEARVFLTQGAPDLQRLLKSAGTADVQVDVNAFGVDQHSEHQPGHQSGFHDLPGTPMGSEGSGPRTGQHGAPARMRSATTATDGDQDLAHGPGSVDPSTSTPRGVDVRM